MDFFHIILSVLPLFIFCLLLLFRHSTSSFKISLVTLLITIIIAVVFWHSSLFLVAFSLARGFFIALDIFFIIFGAILFLEMLKKKKIMENLAFYLDNFSPDFRIQIIMLAWFLENFLEGIAGFGTPSIVVAPLLIALGLSPVKAVILSLLGNSVAVPFGAVGTPIRIGFANLSVNQLAIGTTSAAINFVGLIVPVFMLWVLVSSKPKRFHLFFEALPFALWSGIAFVLPSYLISLFGIEFPSIIGSIIGIILIMITNHFGLFVPRNIFPRQSLTSMEINKPLKPKQVIFPYALFILLLIFAKIFFSSTVIKLPLISYSFNLFNPGFVFIVTALILVFCFKIKWSIFFATMKISIKKSIEPFLVIVAMSSVVQLMNNSANSLYQLPSMTQTFSRLFTTSLLPVLAPFIGTLGSLVTGSATVSCVMFASSVYQSSLSLGLNHINNLSLMLVGAGAGNMIAISDVLTAKTVAGDNTSLRDTIVSILPYCLIFLGIISFVAFILV